VKAIQLYNELKRSFPGITIIIINIIIITITTISIIIFLDFSKNFLATNICIDVMYAVVL
jgi:hypothetical protein